MFQLLPNRSPSLPSSVAVSTATTIVVFLATVAALYFGREVLVPIALALLLSFVLAPIVRRLQSWHFPRIAAVSIVAIFAFATIFGLGAFVPTTSSSAWTACRPPSSIRRRQLNSKLGATPAGRRKATSRAASSPRPAGSSRRSANGDAAGLT